MSTWLVLVLTFFVGVSFFVGVCDVYVASVGTGFFCGCMRCVCDQCRYWLSLWVYVMCMWPIVLVLTFVVGVCDVYVASIGTDFLCGCMRCVCG